MNIDKGNNNREMIRLLLAVVLTTCLRSIKDFGMNKPHLLYSTGDRQMVAVNYGMGYWTRIIGPIKNESERASPLRHRYKNAKEGIYIDVQSHDADAHSHQRIHDYHLNVRLDTRFQLYPHHWQQMLSFQRIQQHYPFHIQLQNQYTSQSIPPIHQSHSKSNEDGNKKDQSSAHNLKKWGNISDSELNWVMYMTVENNDLSKVQQETLSSPIAFRIQHAQHSKIVTEIQGFKKQLVTVIAPSIRVLGVTVNISETFNALELLQTAKDLIQIKDNPRAVRTADKQRKKWENDQVKRMKQDPSYSHSYTVLFFYGKGEANISFSNSTTAVDKVDSQQIFDRGAFEKRKKEVLMVFSGEKEQMFLRHMLFNLYGGLVFYQGRLFTQNSILNHETDWVYGFTPSRLLFPRSFLWDDGFHLNVAVWHRPDLASAILGSWLRKIDLFGWVGREQIRGLEMGSLMPDMQFIYQDILEMNPPTLLLAIHTLIQNNSTDQGKEQEQQERLKEGQLRQLLVNNFWRLQKWYRYFTRTQVHSELQQKEEIGRKQMYRWRCKDACKESNFMGSGLDDYPRTEYSLQISTQHVDLLAWMQFFSSELAYIARHLNLSKAAAYYRQQQASFKAKIFNECLDPTDHILKDLAVNNKYQLEIQFVTRNGYISILPFALGAYQGATSQQIDASFQATLRLMLNQSELLSEDGLRSLSISDPAYGSKENYWRGPVWLPINYLVLRACKKYYAHSPLAQQLYDTLRTRLIRTTKRDWQRTGYLFENYHQGKGNRGFPFYGWTTLLINIITQCY